jgi:glutamine amidotransferase
LIHIVDYGLGNTQAIMNTYKRLGIDATRSRTKDDLQDVTRLILPGVGAFDHAMELLNASGMLETLEHFVKQEKVPVLGICVGMQILASSSDEGTSPGLGWVEGRVRSFAGNARSFTQQMPHMGWNDVLPTVETPLFHGLKQDSRFYFLHSYYFDSEHASNVLAHADYGFQFHCAVQNENVYGVQFHPEKSHHWGAKLLKNFAEL